MRPADTVLPLSRCAQRIVISALGACAVIALARRDDLFTHLFGPAPAPLLLSGTVGPRRLLDGPLGVLLSPLSGATEMLFRQQTISLDEEALTTEDRYDPPGTEWN